MIELTVEEHFCTAVKRTGGEVRKVVPRAPRRAGSAVRLAQRPTRLGRAEAAVRRVRGASAARTRALRSMGLPVDVVDTVEATDAYVARMVA